MVRLFNQCANMYVNLLLVSEEFGFEEYGVMVVLVIRAHYLAT